MKERCCQEVHDSGRGCGFHPCPFWAVVTRAGKHYCKKHDPDAVKARHAERDARWDAESKAQQRIWRLRESAVESYQKHFTNPLQAAEEDALGEALQLLDELLRTIGDGTTTDQSIMAARALLARTKGASMIMQQKRRRIRQNAWGNWYGYDGKRRVVVFNNTPCESMEQQAQRWLLETGPFNPNPWQP